jgi:DNA-binding response OmpR family regulator
MGEGMPKKILVVDDEPHTCEAVRLLLESEGFKVEIANTVQECAAKVKKETPDLVLLDILLPGVSGTSAIRSLMNSLSGIKIIMFSVISTDYFKKLCKELGAVDYITKPFDNEDLVRRVKKALGE